MSSSDTSRFFKIFTKVRGQGALEHLPHLTPVLKALIISSLREKMVLLFKKKMFRNFDYY